MKTLLLSSICSIAMAAAVLAQGPSVSPVASPNSTSPAASVSPAISPSTSPASDMADRLRNRIDKKLKQKGVHISIGDDDEDEVSVSKDGEHHPAKHAGSGDIPEMVLPIVVVSLLTIFGAPVLIVAVIMYFGFSRNRMMHRTVRMMVEKGQPVPEALLNPPPHVRKRSDMRRGVVLVCIGLGLALFLGAVNDWEGGAWALGVIPFMIGAGYLLVWKLEGKGMHDGSADNPPPLP